MPLQESSAHSDPLLLLADALDPVVPTRAEIYAALGFEPNCLVQEAAREAGLPVPPACGDCAQERFLDSREFDVGYGGAAGGGKTKALLITGITDCIEYPGIEVWAFRRTMPELRDSLLKEAANYGYAKALGAKWRASTNDLVFANASVMRFRYCESMVDATRYQGAEMQRLLIDERTLMQPGVIDFLSTRLRTSNPRIPVLGIRSGTNPGGVGHGAFKKRYVTATNYGEHSYVDKRGRPVRFIPAKIDDNPRLNQEYKDDLEATEDLALRAALKDGNWDTFAGQYFSEWDHDRHVVKPFAIPSEWRRLQSIDWGYAAPHAVEWAALDVDGRVWFYRELYGTKTGEREVARQVLDAEGALTDEGARRRGTKERISVRVGDPSMWSKIGDANPIAQTFIAGGVPLTKASNDRLAGWQRLHTYLAEAPACQLHRDMGWETCPLLHVFETSTELIRTLPELVHDKKRPEDVDSDGEDHAPDALRYLVMELPVPVTAREPKAEDLDPVARHRRKAAQRKTGSHPLLGRIR